MTPSCGDIPVLCCERRTDGMKGDNLLEELKAISTVDAIIKVSEGSASTRSRQ